MKKRTDTMAGRASDGYQMRAETGVSRDTGSRPPASSGRTPRQESSRRAEPERTVDPTAFKGLCMTCKTRLTCTFPRDPKVPVVFCDEFCGLERDDCYAKPAPAEPGKPKTPARFNPNLKGLCKTCDLADTCQFPKLEGGVWHCEEYK